MLNRMANEIDWSEPLEAVGEDCLGSVVIDDAFHVRSASETMLHRLGMSRSGAQSKSALDLFHSADIGRAAVALGRASSGEPAVVPGIFRVISRAGTWDTYEIAVTALDGENSAAVRIDFVEASAEQRVRALIDDSVELSQLLVESSVSLRESFRSISDFAERNIDGLSLSITVFSEDGSSATFCQRELDDAITAMNAAAHPLSLPPHVVEAYSLAKLRAWRADDEVGAILPDEPRRMTMVLLDPDDNLLGYVDAYRSKSSPPDDDEWRVYRLIAQTLRAVMLNTQRDVRIDYLGTSDPLTGLANRYSMLERMASAELANTGVLVINLDGFRWVNKSLGFAAGDRVLTSVAASILSAIPSTAVAARLSGDEFLVWLPQMTDADEVFRASEDLRKAIMVPIDNADRRGRTRCSIGSTRVVPDESVDDVIHRATAAMEEAKQAGGDRVTHR